MVKLAPLSSLFLGQNRDSWQVYAGAMFYYTAKTVVLKLHHAPVLI